MAILRVADTLTEGFLRYRFGGLIHGGAYFRNFTVFCSMHVVKPFEIYKKMIVNLW